MVPLHLTQVGTPANDEHFVFDVVELFNPLKRFEREDACHDIPPCMLASSQHSRVELRLGAGPDETMERNNRWNSNPRGRRVHFSENDEIITIPSHSSYSDEEHDYMWSNPYEIEENAHRNRIEYRYEGHWRLVLEEDQFILCSDGKLYHPVTVQLYLRQLEEYWARQRREEAKRLSVLKGKVIPSLWETIQGERKGQLSNAWPPRPSDEMPVKASFNQPIHGLILIPNLADSIVPHLAASVA